MRALNLNVFALALLAGLGVTLGSGTSGDAYAKVGRKQVQKARLARTGDQPAFMTASRAGLAPQKVSGPVDMPNVIRAARAQRAPVMLQEQVALFHGSNYRCKLLGDLTRFVVSPSRAMDLSLTEFSVGGTQLATADPATLTPELYGTSAIRWDRGGVTEICERRDKEVKQSFVVAARPATAGDLVVRYRLTTGLEAPADGMQAPSLTFNKGGEPTIVIKDALVMDADGRTLTVDLLYANNELSLRVPQSWLDQASYPVTVDPTIGSTISVDVTASGGASEDDDSLLWPPVSTDYSSGLDQYIVVWTELFATAAASGGPTDDYDVWYCRVVAGTGALATATAPATNPGIVATGPDAQGPAQVAYDATSARYLVAYNHFDGVTLGWIKGTVITDAGAVSAPSMFDINPDQIGDVFFETNPDVAAIGGTWLVVWQHTTATVSGAPISGRIVSGPGTLVGAGSALATDDTTVVEGRPSVAYSSVTGTCMVAWDTGTDAAAPTKEVRACIATLSPLTFGPTTGISTIDAVEDRFPDLTADTTVAGGRWLIAWEEVITPGSAALPIDGDVYGRLYTSSGTTITAFAAAVLLAGAGTTDGNPRVCYNAPTSSYMLVFHRLIWSSPVPPSAVTSSDIIGMRLGPTLTALETATVVSTALLEVWPTVACRTTWPQQALVGWLVFDTTATPTNLYPLCIRFDMPGGVPPPPPPPPPPGPGGGGSALGNPDCADKWYSINDTLCGCGVTSPAAGSLMWLALALCALLAVARARA